MGQKYLGASRPESRVDAIFSTNVPEVDGVHPVPVTNFMNAQCKLYRTMGPRSRHTLTSESL